VRKLGLRARWAVPAGVVAVTGLVIAAAAVATAEAAPSLPPRTAAQLLAEVAQGSKVPLGPLSATVQETSNLGLPQLPAFTQQGNGPTGLTTTGSKSISIWYRDPQHLRVAEMVQAGETDLRLNGRTLWVWDSKTQTATRYALPAHFSGVPAIKRNGLVLPRRHYASSAVGSPVPDTPQAAAEQLLKAVGPTTVVSVQRNVYVAGQAAYQLSLVPRSSKSLVGSVLIAIDAARHIPLRVEVYSRASSTLAYSIGFTALTFGAPAASNFSFTPPAGAAVKHVTVPSSPQAAQQAGLGIGALEGLGPLRAVVGASVSTGVAGSSAPLARAQALHIALPRSIPAIPKNQLAMFKAEFAKNLPKSMSAAQRARAIKMFDQQFARSRKAFPLIATGSKISRVRIASNNGGGFINLKTAPIAAANASAPHVIGTGWLSVLATPPSSQVANALKQALSAAGGQPRGSATYGGFYGSSSSSVSSASASSVSGLASGPAIPAPAVLQALLKASSPVHGSWGSGRLLQTTLLNVLITSKGQILAGAVTPALLYADVARDAG
jgi:outer membrane lipoprotein-sorting protein